MFSCSSSSVSSVVQFYGLFSSCSSTVGIWSVLHRCFWPATMRLHVLGFFTTPNQDRTLYVYFTRLTYVVHITMMFSYTCII